jgi:hypothetical protein
MFNNRLKKLLAALDVFLAVTAFTVVSTFLGIILIAVMGYKVLIDLYSVQGILLYGSVGIVVLFLSLIITLLIEVMFVLVFGSSIRDEPNVELPLL